MSLDLFVTAAGTEIGKTYLVEQLIHECSARGISCDALKPIVTGFDDSGETDTARVLRALNLPINDHTVDACSPWRFTEPLSPHMAASREGRAIPVNELVEFCRQPSEARLRLIEGVGGVIVPLNEHETTADWIAALGIPAVLVVGTYLGAISHGLTAYEALHARGIAIQGVVVNESENSTVPLEETFATFRQFCRPGPVVLVQRDQEQTTSLLAALQLLPGES